MDGNCTEIFLYKIGFWMKEAMCFKPSSVLCPIIIDFNFSSNVPIFFKSFKGSSGMKRSLMAKVLSMTGCQCQFGNFKLFRIIVVESTFIFKQSITFWKFIAFWEKRWLWFITIITFDNGNYNSTLLVLQPSLFANSNVIFLL